LVSKFFEARKEDVATEVVVLFVLFDFGKNLLAITRKASLTEASVARSKPATLAFSGRDDLAQIVKPGADIGEG
jgi:hypothetical protein